MITYFLLYNSPISISNTITPPSIHYVITLIIFPFYSRKNNSLTLINNPLIVNQAIFDDIIIRIRQRIAVQAPINQIIATVEHPTRPK